MLCLLMTTDDIRWQIKNTLIGYFNKQFTIDETIERLNEIYGAKNENVDVQSKDIVQ